MRFSFDHNNFNVVDLERSLEFYREALGLQEVSRKCAADGSYIICFLSDGIGSHRLELTWLRDFDKDRYDLGDEEFHLALRTDDYEASLEKHRAMGCVAMENERMGIYFITDPDGYWIEILPPAKS